MCSCVVSEGGLTHRVMGTTSVVVKSCPEQDELLSLVGGLRLHVHPDADNYV